MALTKAGGNRGGTRRRPNKRTEKNVRLAEEKGMTPLEFLLENMLNEENDLPVRLQCAKDAAPYVHSKLATTTVRGDETKPVTLKIIGIETE